jgi:hypothetical protein
MTLERGAGRVIVQSNGQRVRDNGASEHEANERTVPTTNAHPEPSSATRESNAPQTQPPQTQPAQTQPA